MYQCGYSQSPFHHFGLVKNAMVDGIDERNIVFMNEEVLGLAVGNRCLSDREITDQANQKQYVVSVEHRASFHSLYSPFFN